MPPCFHHVWEKSAGFEGVLWVQGLFTSMLARLCLTLPMAVPSYDISASSLAGDGGCGKAVGKTRLKFSI